MTPASTPVTGRRAQLIAAAESYFNGLRAKNVSGVLWHENVVARSPITAGYPEPLVGRATLVEYFRTLLPLLGDVEVVQHFIAPDESAIATCAMVTVGGAVLRVIDRFTVDSQGLITDQENHYDPRPAIPKPLEHLFSYSASVTPPQVIGPLPEGIRAHVFVTGGTVSGPRLKGTVLPNGGDWLLLRTDGIGLVDVRGTMQAEDGALIYTTYTGTIDFGADGYEKFLAGQLPPRLSIRTAPRFHTANPKHQWLNRLQCVGIGECDTATMVVSYDVYAVR